MPAKAIQNTKKLLRAAVIGLGRQSLNDHVPALLRRNDVEIVSISDVNQAAHDTFYELYPALKGKVQPFQRFEEAIDQDIDFAIVAIPHDQYLAVSRVLCEKKIPFMKEKPFARTLDETIALASTPDIARYCFICTQRRYHPLYIKARTALEDIGKLGSFNATYTLNIPQAASGWRKYADVCGGGVVIDMGYHIIDQLIWWFGYPDDIHANISNISTTDNMYDTEDTATISFAYRKLGMQGSIILSRCTGKKTEEYQIAGSECFMEGGKDSLAIKNRMTGELLFEEREAYKEQMMDNQLAFFVEAFTNGKSFEQNHLDNLLNMKFIERCYRETLTKDHTLFINTYKHVNLRPLNTNLIH
jgi:predicted dehydrogenase